MKWILVTGGTGFIGTNLCKKLLEKGKYVIALDNQITSDTKQRDVFSSNSHYRYIHHDIIHTIPPDLTLSGISIETIYHLACPTGVTNLVPLALEMALTCSIGTKNILDLARVHNADIVYASSSEVYGNPTMFPQGENYTGNVSSTGIRSPYEEGKRFSEMLINVYAQKYHLRTKIVRIFNTYGPFMALSDTRVIPKFIHQIKNKKPITIQGDGTHTRTFCFVDDLVRGLQLIQKHGKEGEIYNLGSSNEITIFELAKKIISFRKGGINVVFTPELQEDHVRRLPLLDKVHKLGWHTTVDLNEGLEKTLQWYGL